MQIYHDFPPEALTNSSYLSIGSFDGIHRGHQALIGHMVETAHASGCLAGVLTFDPHPLAVLRPELALAQLSTVDERAEILAALGADFVVILPFTRETAATSAADFVKLLVAHLNLKSLWVRA